MFFPIDVSAFEQVKALFQEDADGKDVTVRVDMGRLFINGPDSELMVRFFDVTKSIVIARVRFQHPRSGHGGRLLRELSAYGRAHGYRKLVLENILTEDALRFAQKYGFEPVVDPFSLVSPGPGYYGNHERPLL